MNGWRKSSEQLPPPLGENERHVYYIATIDCYDEYRTTTILWWNGWNRTMGDDGHAEVGNDYVVAWMPFPEPWKEEEDECI